MTSAYKTCLKPFYYYFYVFGINAFPNDVKPVWPVKILHYISKILIVVITSFAYSVNIFEILVIKRAHVNLGSQYLMIMEGIPLLAFLNITLFCITYFLIGKRRSSFALSCSVFIEMDLSEEIGKSLRVAANHVWGFSVFLMISTSVIFSLLTLSYNCMTSVTFMVSFFPLFYGVIVVQFVNMYLAAMYVSNIFIEHICIDIQMKMKMPRSTFKAHTNLQTAILKYIQVQTITSAMNSASSELIFVLYYYVVIISSKILFFLAVIFKDDNSFIYFLELFIPFFCVFELLILFICVLRSMGKVKHMVISLQSFNTGLLISLLYIISIFTSP